MTKDLKQLCFHVPIIPFAQFENHAKSDNLRLYEAVAEAVDQLVEKYDPFDAEKMKEWAAKPVDLKEQSLQALYLRTEQITTLDNFADLASKALQQSVTRAAVLRSAIIEYLRKE